MSFIIGRVVEDNKVVVLEIKVISTVVVLSVCCCIDTSNSSAVVELTVNYLLLIPVT